MSVSSVTVTTIFFILAAFNLLTPYSCVCIAFADLHSVTYPAIRAFQIVNGGTVTNSGTASSFIIVIDFFLGSQILVTLA